jgi:hypothetical protein
MWCKKETVFVDGKMFDSHCCFDDHEVNEDGYLFTNSDYPMNTCEKYCRGRIEIRTDWFETEELAHLFCEGVITYVHTHEIRYNNTTKSRFIKLVKRDIIKVGDLGLAHPYRGINAYIDKTEGADKYVRV